MYQESDSHTKNPSTMGGLKSFWPKSKKRLVIIVTVILLVVVGLFLIIYFHNRNSPLSPQLSAMHLTPDQEYLYLSSEGKYSSAQQVLQQQLSKTNNINDKLNIYYEQSELAIKYKNFSDAEMYADKAKSLAPSSSTPYVALAQLSTAEGDKAKAIQFWQQAINNLNQNALGYNLIKQNYQSSLDALQ